MALADKIFGTPSSRELRRITPLKNSVLSLEDRYRAMSDQQLKGMTAVFREKLSMGASLDDILPDAFAVCREASIRVLSQTPYPVQVLGGIVLHSGKIAEMKTGEGKTLVSTLPAYLNALSGNGVHIVTVNDYLARRDSEWMGKVHNFLGLSVGLIVHGLNSIERKKEYNCDITYATNNELGFDYLRDNMVLSLDNKSQRAHRYAIVDEVDSILIDEARTPLIISGPGEKSTDLYERADRFAGTLRVMRITEHDSKVDMDEVAAEYDVIVDEKARSASLTEKGILKAQTHFKIDNLADSEHMTLSHHINQAIRARSVMQRDVDYVVQNGEVIIVDEFTGRLMIGRRYNEGLHQAIEAKEHVEVARENKTLATITFQNYFRMYEKLSGMTGTALTEQQEFSEIYGLDVVEIPTNMPMIRKDFDDAVFVTEKGKHENVIEQVIECHSRNQPVLVGTVSIEKSELLSRQLSRRGIKHEVLNAKFHDKEAVIVAQAGKPGSVTIATNMAGRGTDIMLGGNPEFMARSLMLKEGATDDDIYSATSRYDTDNPEILRLRSRFSELHEAFKQEVAPLAAEVIEAGGLFIIGTERHESRRIDNQLRGRSGRQGDPGMSRFFLSLDDDLMRLFGGDRLTAIMETLNVEENIPIQNRMLTGVIEGSQKKIEARNFSIRKNVLDYDDVMNRMRETIYSQRDMVLQGDNMKDRIITMINDSIVSNVSLFAADEEDSSTWNLPGLRAHYIGWLTTSKDLVYTDSELEQLTIEDIKELLISKAALRYAEREERFGADVMRHLERMVLLRVVDEKWMNHIDDMDQLRQGMYLRSYGQKNPVVEYRFEGYSMFDDMIEAIREDTAKLMLTVEIISESEQREKALARLRMANAVSALSAGPKKKPIRNTVAKIGRNDPCPCGSGKKYKNCCGRTPEVSA
ncbi:MAG: preprotein translocase subunit SecA [Oscillospiraceae bacterium]|nr:preprotein translocase subunit SecA [Oscillospiraceae bacterium]